VVYVALFRTIAHHIRHIVPQMRLKLDLAAITTFCRAIEAGNLTAAAKLMHITKSVASRRIQTLEEELGVRLLARTTRGVSPTDEGSLFYERAQKILDDLDDAQQSVKHASGNLVGTIRMTAPRSFADLHLHAAITAFMQEQPALTLELNLTDERVDIVGGGYDLALRIASQLNDSALIARKIAPIGNYVVASPNYLETHGTPTRPEDLKDHKCLFYANMSANQQWRFSDGKQEKAVRVTGPLSSNSGILQLEAAVKGLGIATLPNFFIHDALKDGRLVTILEDYPRAESWLYALYPEKRYLPLKVSALIDFLNVWFADKERRKYL